MARDVYETSDSTEVVERKDGLATGLVVLTTLALLGAVVLVHQAMKKHFNTGFFGKSKDGKPIPESVEVNK